jgi:hypothetical protein
MFSTPILFLIYNRPETTKTVFERIREIKPKYLFVAADGPQEESIELEKCEQSRSVVSLVDWDCEVKTLFRLKNLGCRDAVRTALEWFFSHVEEGIILEDDCYPSISFFRYCELLLEKYRYDERILSINGCNYGYTYDGASYFFSRFFNAWGWATWRRVANSIAYEIPDWEAMEDEGKKYFIQSRLKLKYIDLDAPWFEYWVSIFDAISSKKLDTWDYFWLYHQTKNGLLSVLPSHNIIKNLGFGEFATHTLYDAHPAAFLNAVEVAQPLIYNNKVKPDLGFEIKALQPINYMYQRKSNLYYIKKMIQESPVVSSVSNLRKKYLNK